MNTVLFDFSRNTRWVGGSALYDAPGGTLMGARITSIKFEEFRDFGAGVLRVGLGRPAVGVFERVGRYEWVLTDEQPRVVEFEVGGRRDTAYSSRKYLSALELCSRHLQLTMFLPGSGPVQLPTF